MLTREKTWNLEHNSVSVNTDSSLDVKIEKSEIARDIKKDSSIKIEKEETKGSVPPLDFSQIPQKDFDREAENAFAEFLQNAQNNIKRELPIGDSKNLDGRTNISSPQEIQCLLKMWRLILIDYMADCKIFNLLYDQKLEFVKYHIDPLILLCDLNVPYGNIIRKLHITITSLYDIISVNKMHNIVVCKEKVTDFDSFEELCLKLFNTISYIQNYEITSYL